MFIPDNVKALFDMWFLGDNFLQDLAQTYETIRQKAEHSNDNKTFLLQYYNVKNIYKKLSVGVKRTAARVINSLIDTLNQENKLPHFLVVILDKDVISDVDVLDGHASRIVADMIRWIVRQINMLITRKRSELLEKRPGAVFLGDPKIIFVRMLRRYEKYHQGSKLDNLYSLRAKFNESLKAAVAEISQKMLTITSCNTRDHFDFWGNLSVRGKLDFWQEIDELLDLFDQHKIKLLPTPKNPNQLQNHSDSQNRSSDPDLKFPDKHSSKHNRGFCREF